MARGALVSVDTFRLALEGGCFIIRTREILGPRWEFRSFGRFGQALFDGKQRLQGDARDELQTIPIIGFGFSKL